MLAFESYATSATQKIKFNNKHFFSKYDQIRHFLRLYSGNKKIIKFVTANRGPRIWNLILENVRNASPFNTFKEKIKN